VDDVSLVCTARPELPADALTIGIYNRLRADAAEFVEADTLRDVPPFAGGATTRYAELCVLVGQLAARLEFGRQPEDEEEEQEEHP